ncbi:MAG TPA: SGNH/GDSL hydrolase family protein [Balneolaceae bacterium]|nr:SGNH/GDSL hydrolase family protein [Balneolaceae bacterium]
MTSLSKSILLLVILAVAFVGCDGEYDSLVDANLDRNPIPDTDIEVSAGDADFSNYVAIGNSLTAGFMDGALYNNGQDLSLAAQLSGQFEFTGAPATFNQPDINSVNGFNTLANSGNGPILGRFKLDTSIPGPSPTINGDPIEPYMGSASALNNFGVPGIQLGQLLTPETGNPSSPAFNPFYARFASSAGTSTILGDAISSDPTFFTLWIGNNDVLGYASSGATRPEILTSQSNFQAQFSATITRLMTETTASGVVANIPPILATPVFRAVPYNAIELSAEEAEALNTNFTTLNAVFDGMADNTFLFGDFTQEDADRRKVSYQAGNNPILIIDPALDDLSDEFDQLETFEQITPEQRAALQPYVQSRQMVVDPQTGPELVLLSAGSVLGTPAVPGDPNTPIGVAIPLGAQYTLTSASIVEIETARATFNAIIEGTVTAAGDRLALYDTNALGGAFADIFGLDGTDPGIMVDGVFLNPDFSPNGVFSTDGVHPNARGNAILANEFLRVIEAEFNAAIPKIDVTALPSVSLCAGDCVSQQDGS